MNTRTRLGGWLGSLAGFLLAFAPQAQAVENVATNSGNWEAEATWSAGLPASDHDVVIPAGITVTNTGLTAREINSLTITGTLTHAANGNYPSPGEQHKIILDVAGNVTIASGGAIDVSSNGYAKAQGPGGSATYAGSHGGEGGIASGGTRGTTYGSVTAPTALGSGGKENAGGGTVILRIGGTVTVELDGAIRADGQPTVASGNAGAGGSVFITAGAVSGQGTISAKGGQGRTSAPSGTSGGGGRIAIVVTNATGFGLLAFDVASGTANAYLESGAAGTVYLKDTTPGSDGKLLVDAQGRANKGAMTTIAEETNRFDSIILTNSAFLTPIGAGALDLRNDPTIATDASSRFALGRGTILWANPALIRGTFSQYGTNVYAFTNAVTVAAGGQLTQEANGNWPTPGEVHKLNLTIAGNATVNSNGAINVTSKGYAGTQGPGYLDRTAGHGGEGGAYNNQRGPTYGSITNPTSLGSGGKAPAQGGGAAILRVDGVLAIQAGGAIRADGDSNTGYGGFGGAGGSINIAAGSLAGNGAISANGGASHSLGGAGGGGRIAVVVTNAPGFGSVSTVAFGGSAGAEKGAAGTIYLQSASQGAGAGTVTLNNNAQTTGARTQIPAATNAVLDELRYASVIVTNRGALAITVSDQIASLTVASTNEPLNLGAADTVLRIDGDMTFGATTYTKGGTYTTNNWNGFSLPGANVTGNGAILLWRTTGTVITLW